MSSPKLLSLAQEYPVLTLTGPRQSGKTTLTKHLFKNYDYKNLEDPEVRALAKSDPRQFLKTSGPGIIIDEFQRFPELASYIQVIVDEDPTPGRYILTGSQQLELSQTVSQSLAGRTAIAKLLPLSYRELYKQKKEPLEEVLFKGFLPRIHSNNLNPTQAHSGHIQTYIERDIQQISQIKNLRQFESFLYLLASEIGQTLNANRMANDLGVDSKTIQSWISILQASYFIFLLQPHFKNLRKRVVKSPKLYFYDVGLASFLLKMKSPEAFWQMPNKGFLFENFIIAEALKNRLHNLELNNLYFYRDSNGNEVDLLIDNGASIDIAEIKLGSTFSPEFLKGIDYYSKLNNAVKNKYIISPNDSKDTVRGTQLLSYQLIHKV